MTLVPETRHVEFVNAHSDALLNHVNVVHALATASTMEIRQQLQTVVTRLHTEGHEVSMQAVARTSTVCNFAAAVRHLLVHHTAWETFRHRDTLLKTCRLYRTESLSVLYSASSHDYVFWLDTVLLDHLWSIPQYIDFLPELVDRIMRIGDVDGLNRMVYGLVQHADRNFPLLQSVLPQIQYSIHGNVPAPTHLFSIVHNAVYHQSPGCLQALLRIDTIRQSVDTCLQPTRFQLPSWPLRTAASMGHVDCVRQLLQAGADPNFTGPFSESALSGNTLRFPEVVQVLLHANADPTLCRQPYHNALEEYLHPDCAFDHDFEVVQMFVNHGCTAQLDNQWIHYDWVHHHLLHVPCNST